MTDAGLAIDTLADVRDAIGAAWRKQFGSSMDVSDASPDGVLIGIVSEQIAIVNEALEALVAARRPGGATGAALRGLCSLTGTREIPASFSTVMLTVTGTPSAVVASGSLVSTTSTGQQFTTSIAATIGATTPWTSATWTAGTRANNAGNVYQVVTAGGTPSSAPAPSGTDPTTTYTDGGGTVWRFLGRGTGVADVAARATVTGPIVAAAGDITRIDTPAGGWTGVINLLDAAIGRAAMTDAQLRVLRALELAQPGTGPVDAISAALLLVPGVTACTVFNNPTDTTDGSGLPPHQIEAMVRGGADQDIFDALRANVPAGILTHGTVAGTSIDSKGRPQPTAFSRVADVQVFVTLAITVDAARFPSDGAAQVALAVATWGNAQDDGLDVSAGAVLAQAFLVPGVIDAALPFIGITASPTSSATIAITSRQHAVYDTSRIVVTATPRVP